MKSKRFDISLIPDDELAAEYWRRMHARGKITNSGRPKKLRPCPKCGEQMGARQLDIHKPACMSTRIQFVECKSPIIAARRCPWAAKIVRVGNGYIAFESIDDYRKQKAKLPHVEQKPLAWMVRRLTEPPGRKPEARTYRISADGKSITCLRCGLTSWHPEDVRQVFCGNCHIFHVR
jgi:hypothetical protein